MPNTLKRYNSIRRADATTDQKISAEILNALANSETQEELQVFFLSRLRQVIFGETSPEHWYDDFLGLGIKSLKELSGGLGGLIRVGVPLVGAKDGINRIFRTAPDHFVHAPSVTGQTIEVWHNGRRLIQTVASSPDGEYWVSESGGVGTGYDTATLLFSPVIKSGLVANYQRV